MTGRRNRPGLPPDIAATHLSLLEKEWRRTGDASLAAEYFQTLSLVWDGAAARTTAQLAARLVLKQAGDTGAHLSGRRARPIAPPWRASSSWPQIRTRPATRKPPPTRRCKTASDDFAAAEAALRDKAPAYLELLNPQASASDLQAVLTDHEAYLRIVVGAARAGSASWSTRPACIPSVVAPDRRADRRPGRPRSSAAPTCAAAGCPTSTSTPARSSTRALLAPVQDRLASIDTLDVDVSGSLASIPFAALVATAPDQAHLDKIHDDQDYTGVDWLARHVAVANTLGPASFIRLRKADSAAAGAAAVPRSMATMCPIPPRSPTRLAKERDLSDACRGQIQHDLQLLGPLPETADEARDVAAKFPGARLVLGQGFTDTDFLHSPDTANADVIMLATHGVLGLSTCFAEPALLTSVGDSGDGLIEASQLFDTPAEGAGGGALGLRHRRRRQARRSAHRPGGRRRCAERPGARLHLCRRPQRAGHRMEGRCGHLQRRDQRLPAGRRASRTRGWARRWPTPRSRSTTRPRPRTPSIGRPSSWWAMAAVTFERKPAAVIVPRRGCGRPKVEGRAVAA